MLRIAKTRKNIRRVYRRGNKFSFRKGGSLVGYYYEREHDGEINWHYQDLVASYFAGGRPSQQWVYNHFPYN